MKYKISYVGYDMNTPTIVTRETNLTFPLRSEPVVLFVLSMMILKTRCDLELSEFISMKIFRNTLWHHTTLNQTSIACFRLFLPHHTISYTILYYIIKLQTMVYN